MRKAMRCRAGFTLVELLVCIAVIGVLVTMLLPALGKAQRVAWQTQCLANKRGIGNAAITYTFDYNMQLPCGLLVNSGVVDPTNPGWLQGGNPKCGTFVSQFNPMISPQGEIVWKGYSSNLISNFLCPTWGRQKLTIPGTHADRNWYPDAARNVAGTWLALLKRQGTGFNGTENYTSNYEQWYADLIPGTNYQPGQQGFRYNMQRLDYIEQYWNKGCRFNQNSIYWTARGSYSPALICDTNYSSWVSDPTQYPVGACHYFDGEVQGVNCYFYDGSGRYITKQEVKRNSPLGTGDSMMTSDNPLLTGFSTWLKRTGTPYPR